MGRQRSLTEADNALKTPTGSGGGSRYEREAGKELAARSIAAGEGPPGVGEGLGRISPPDVWAG